MIRIAFLVTSVVAVVSAPEAARTASVHVVYSPFGMSDGHRLDAFEENALCRFERDANDPVMRRVWAIVSNAAETKDSTAVFDDQLVRLKLVHRDLGTTYWVDQRGRVRVAPNMPPRRIDEAALQEVDNALEDMCPRTKRAKDARRERSKKHAQ